MPQRLAGLPPSSCVTENFTPPPDNACLVPSRGSLHHHVSSEVRQANVNARQARAVPLSCTDPADSKDIHSPVLYQDGVALPGSCHIDNRFGDQLSHRII